MFNLFSRKPVLGDEGSTEWLFEAYAWALRNFGSDLFRQDTVLVTPSERHFPDKALSAEEAVSTSFKRVIAYAGMQNWPLQPQPMEGCSTLPALPVEVSQAPRGPAAVVSAPGMTSGIPIAFDIQHARNPLLLIAVFAQELAKFLVKTTDEPPLGGPEMLGLATDLVAVFMGFGLFMANSALVVTRSGCSGCAVGVQQLGYLTEDEFTYALAIFCALKDIPEQEVLPSLKKNLRSTYGKAAKELTKSRAPDVLRLRDLDYPIKPAVTARPIAAPLAQSSAA